jgi:hypothetical protein
MAGGLLAWSAVLHSGALLAPQPYSPALLSPGRAFARRMGRTPRADAAGDVTAVDVAVIGGGPAGHIMAALLGRDAHKVALVDPYPNRPWPNNYGAWRAEWESLSASLRLPELLTRCIHKEWDVTDCYFGGSHGMPPEQQTRLQVPYVQVGRAALKSTLNEIMDVSGVLRFQASLDAKLSAPNLFDSEALLHDADGSSLILSDGTRLRAKLVIDATGFESRITLRESAAAMGLWKELSPGYQIAYGFRCDCVGGHAPYAVEAMTLFDYRTDHLAGDPKWEKGAIDRPSFIYAMPQVRLRAFHSYLSPCGICPCCLYSVNSSTCNRPAVLHLRHATGGRTCVRASSPCSSLHHSLAGIFPLPHPNQPICLITGRPVRWLFPPLPDLHSAPPSGTRSPSL